MKIHLLAFLVLTASVNITFASQRKPLQNHVLHETTRYITDPSTSETMEDLINAVVDSENWQTDENITYALLMAIRMIPFECLESCEYPREFGTIPRSPTYQLKNGMRVCPTCKPKLQRAINAVGFLMRNGANIETVKSMPWSPQPSPSSPTIYDRLQAFLTLKEPSDHFLVSDIAKHASIAVFTVEAKSDITKHEKAPDIFTTETDDWVVVLHQ